METLEVVYSYIRLLVMYVILILIIQFCVNTIIAIFNIPEISFMQTLSGFILYWMLIYFTSNAWVKGSK